VSGQLPSGPNLSFFSFFSFPPFSFYYSNRVNIDAQDGGEGILESGDMTSEMKLVEDITN
jgi:hypothetical protein